MGFQEPFKIYVANNNMEAHLVVNMLSAGGVAAYADEDRSGVGMAIFGGQVYRPNVWVEKSTAEKTLGLIRSYEDKKHEYVALDKNEGEIEVVCEECEKTSTYSQTLGGTVQDCSHCHAFVDVGELNWDEDFGEPQE